MSIPIPTDDVQHFTYLIIGSKGRGKSSLILKLINDPNKFKKKYDNIFLCSMTAHLDDKFKRLIDDISDQGKYYNTFSEEIVGDIMKKILELNEAGKELNPHIRNLLIFDDCISHMSNATDRHSAFNQLIVSSRHLRSDLIITSQQYRRLNNLVRANVDIITLFKTDNKKEKKAYEEELNIDPKLFLELLGLLEKKHSYLTINFLGDNPTFFIKN